MGWTKVGGEGGGGGRVYTLKREEEDAGEGRGGGPRLGGVGGPGRGLEEEVVEVCCWGGGR